MDSRLPFYLVSSLMLTAFLAPPEGHAATSEQKCTIAKLKAAGKRTSAKLVCHQKALAVNSSADPACLRKAETAFLKTIEQTEKKL